MRQAQGIYMISVVAETLDMHPQTLRKYERAGFVEPRRMGTLRAYSDEDIARLRLIKHFVEDMGLNLAGVELALDLAGRLLDTRMALSQESRPAKGVTWTVSQIDTMLESLGLRVVERPKSGAKPDAKPDDGARLPEAGAGWFQVNPGESLEFSPAAREMMNARETES